MKCLILYPGKRNKKGLLLSYLCVNFYELMVTIIHREKK